MVETDNDIVKSRLEAYMSRKKLRVTTLEKAAGISVGSLRQTKKPSAEFIRLVLCVCLDLSAEWLMRGEGEMLRSEKQQQQQQPAPKRESTSNKVSPTNNGAMLVGNAEVMAVELNYLRQLVKQKDHTIAFLEDTVQSLLNNRI